MENPVDQQRLNEYQNRVSDWIGRQGVWFQFRYAKTIGSRSLWRHFLGLVSKVVPLLIVFGICGFFILKSHFGTPEYREKITNQISEVLGAEEIEVSGFSRNIKSGKFHRLRIEGGEKSFFFEADFEGLSGVFSYLTGVTEDWNPSFIRVNKADLKLKAGGNEGEMRRGFSSIIESLDGQGVTQVKIDDCSFDWGYSKLTFGAVRNTDFQASLKGGVWEVKLSGGTFQQNWFGPFVIDSATVKLDENGISVESLKLKMGDGSAELEGQIAGPVEMPNFDLKGTFTSLPIEKLIQMRGVNTREYIEGCISGDLAINGSSNRRIEFSGQVMLNENDRLTIREKWSLLRALSILDSDGSYLRIDFDQGGFSFSTAGRGLKVAGIDLTAESRARLKGAFETRLPTQEEAAKTIGIKLTDNFGLDYTDSSSAQKLENDRMRIDTPDEESVFGVDVSKLFEEGKDRGTESKLSVSQLEALRMKREMDIHRISGDLKLAVPAAAFDNSEALLEIYPKDEQGWRWIPVKLREVNFMTISTQAKELLLKQARVRLSDSNSEN